MKRTVSASKGLALLTVVALLAAAAPICRAAEKYVMPTNSAVVDNAVAPDNLKAVAAKATDPQVLLGLAFLAPEGSPARREILELAVKAKPEYAPVAAVIAVSMDDMNDKSVADLIASDPDNALGHYLQGNRLYQAGKEAAALAVLRKAGACPELRLYESITAEALFKALDALNLHGRDRLCALSWAACRFDNFNNHAFQPLRDALPELARRADLGTRKEISDLLLILAGHLFTTNSYNRQFADWDLEEAFRLKAEVAFAEKSPAMNGYVAVCRALVSTSVGWPEIEGNRTAPLETARQLPWTIYTACAFAAPSNSRTSFQGWDADSKTIPAADMDALEIAKEAAVRAMDSLMEIVQKDPDGIMGAYLKGLPPPRKGDSGPWRTPRITYVERLMIRKPELFKAAAEDQQAWQAVSKICSNSLIRRNITQMMDIGKAIISYEEGHPKTYPDSLAVLFETKYLTPPVADKSLLSGRPYVYVAAGQKWPEKSLDFGRFILFYDDDDAHPAGYYYCVFADGHLSRMPVDEVKAQLKAQGKLKE